MLPASIGYLIYAGGLVALFKQITRHPGALLALTALLMLDQPAAADPCAPPKETILLVPALGYEVAGTGRLYFHSAPSEKCVMRDLFVIPGNRLSANEENGQWTSVNYEGKSGPVEGWVETRRLKFIGTVGYTEPRKQDFYRKAAEAAKAGKLGSPFGDLP